MSQENIIEENIVEVINEFNSFVDDICKDICNQTGQSEKSEESENCPTGATGPEGVVGACLGLIERIIEVTKEKQKEREGKHGESDKPSAKPDEKEKKDEIVSVCVGIIKMGEDKSTSVKKTTESLENEGDDDPENEGDDDPDTEGEEGDDENDTDDDTDGDDDRDVIETEEETDDEDEDTEGDDSDNENSDNENIQDSKTGLNPFVYLLTHNNKPCCYCDTIKEAKMWIEKQISTKYFNYSDMSYRFVNYKNGIKVYKRHKYYIIQQESLDSIYEFNLIKYCDF